MTQVGGLLIRKITPKPISRWLWLAEEEVLFVSKNRYLIAMISHRQSQPEPHEKGFMDTC
ncbi:hypothetical protein ccbrp13_61430 [Ktedonobacteria bacterium brp13]|nr:hypothetical protein ccbrp13_61430 [Ktedonobacteria bacterium brp13]